jgi:hypothetical protein
VKGSDSGQCPAACFGISVVERDCPAITVFVESVRLGLFTVNHHLPIPFRLIYISHVIEVV